METPERIYFGEADKSVLDIYSTKEHDDEVEYVRKDVFIERACNWLNKELPVTDLSPSNMLDITFKVFDKESKKRFIEGLKKYMEK